MHIMLWRLRAFVLALPALIGAGYLCWRLSIWGLLQVAAAVAVAPYALGWYEGFYKPWTIRKTQRLVMDVVPVVLEAVDNIIPQLLAEGMRGDMLREVVKQQVEAATMTDLDPALRDTVLDTAIAEAWRIFRPEKMLDRLAATRLDQGKVEGQGQAQQMC